MREKKEWWSAHKAEVYYSICIMTAGTLLHFAYEWSGNSAFVALFAPVSESVWEHLKLFFVPAFFFTIFMYYLVGENCPEYLWCQTKSILSGLGVILVIYYGYTGITRMEIPWISIGIYYVAAVAAGVVSGVCRKKSCNTGQDLAKYAGVVLLLLWALFIWLTYRIPPVLQEYFSGLFLEWEG
ncbi:MAG: DUF6512 family protein [Bacteroidales bacterium]|nr:DUF6512 family protein [Clostridium sp.]MCM1203257.1 DUF6512 family protein [Bacteroidales bacterium]